MSLLTEDPTLAAYDALAPFYDRYTAGYEYERWLDALERLAIDNGLEGHRLLDVGCGTGKSFLPMLARGYEVVACDISPSMVDLAAEKVGSKQVELLVADMRALPDLGPFDLITCLDDAVNYLTGDDDLAAAFASMADNLRAGGLLVFDANTLATYRSFFTRDAAMDADGAFFCWRGQAQPTVEPGDSASAWVEVFSKTEEGVWRRARSHHRQRHHPRWLIEQALAAAGLELLAVRGQEKGARLRPDADEERHVKVVYLARKPPAYEHGGR